MSAVKSQSLFTMLTVISASVHRCAKVSVVTDCAPRNTGSQTHPKGLKVENVYERVQRTVEIITILMHRVVVYSVYKPPNSQFELPAFHRDLPHIVI